MTALYEQKVVHRDLKLDNILIHFPKFKDSLTTEELIKLDLATEPFSVKIADLGFSRGLNNNQRLRTSCGTPLLMAPETLFGVGYDFKVDVWAMGVIYYNLITGLFVFNASNLEELRTKLRQGNWKWPTDVKFSI
jgi:serine/threonine protein kinase